jgi:hypothetical protein
MANFKGNKKGKPSNLLEFAVACHTLIGLWGIRKMSDFFDVVPHQIRQIDKITSLRPKVQEMVEAGKLGIEDAYQVWRSGSADQEKVASAIVELRMTSDEARQFVHLLRKTDANTVDKAKKVFEQTRQKKFDVLVLPLPSSTFKLLSEAARKNGLGVHDFALKVLEDYVDADKK